MKNFIILFLFLFLFIGFSLAVDKSKIYEIRIINHIIEGLFQNKTNVKICLYNFNDDEYKIFKVFSKFKVTNSCNKADIIIVKYIEKKTSFKKPAIAVGYLSFINCVNCVGGFYWKRGRPQVVLVKERLSKFNIKPSNSLKRFIIPEKFVSK